MTMASNGGATQGQAHNDEAMTNNNKSDLIREHTKELVDCLTVSKPAIRVLCLALYSKGVLSVQEEQEIMDNNSSANDSAYRLVTYIRNRIDDSDDKIWIELGKIKALKNIFKKMELKSGEIHSDSATRQGSVQESSSSNGNLGPKEKCEKWKLKIRRKWKFILTCIGLAVVLSTVGIILIVIGTITCPVVIADSMNLTSTDTNSFVSINNNGFKHNTGDITITLAANDDDDVIVDVLRQDCGQTNSINTTLPSIPQNELYSDNFQRVAYNYNGQDNPIFGLTDSELTFNISASTPCTVVTNYTLSVTIRIFENYYLYRDATIPGDTYLPRVDGTVDKSHCLSVGVGTLVSNSTWSYTFDSARFVWATIEHAACVTVNGAISGYIINNTLGSLSPECYLTHQSKTCTINALCNSITCKSTPSQCVYAQVQPTDRFPTITEYKVSYKTRLPYNGCSFFAYFGTVIVLLLLLLLLLFVIVFCCCYYYCCNRNRSNRNRSNSIESSNSSTLLLKHSAVNN